MLLISRYLLISTVLSLYLLALTWFFWSYFARLAAFYDQASLLFTSHQLHDIFLCDFFINCSNEAPFCYLYFDVISGPAVTGKTEYTDPGLLGRHFPRTVGHALYNNATLCSALCDKHLNR